MADLAASDVTYTIERKRVDGEGRSKNLVKMVFGDGALTYPSGGVPLTKAKMGCPNVLESLVLSDPASANGLVYKYDLANEKLRIYEGDFSGSVDASLVELDSGSDAPAAATLYAEVLGW